uniref:Nucleotide-diphospho-sugar transferase domain-containing protein n=1 Tax=viral metagenome TaxID=1070528 RepID=A0A6C0IEB8_9ZZZZ
MVKICSLVIGDDYRKSLKKGLESKRLYAEKHGYSYIQGDEKFWDRERPIAWSKIPFLLHILKTSQEGEFIFMSDADVYITNMNLRIEDHIIPLLPLDKDLLLTIDSCGHINDGNILIRNTKWSRDFWKRVYEQTDLIYHIWWENAAVIKLLEENKSDLAMTEITNSCKTFNAYIQGLDGAPLWTPGDFLVHFAGIYDAEKIGEYMNQIDNGLVPRKSMY